MSQDSVPGFVREIAEERAKEIVYNKWRRRLSIDTRSAAYANAIVGELAADLEKSLLDAIARQREEDCKAACEWCRKGLPKHHYLDSGKWVHPNMRDELLPCDASPIRNATEARNAAGGE